MVKRMDLQYAQKDTRRPAAQFRTIRQHHKYPIGEDSRISSVHVGQRIREKPPLQRANHTGLPDRLKTGMENLSGMSLDHVRVHYNSPAPATVQAHAFTQGSDIHVAPGQAHHVPHELGHVVQQAEGQVTPTTTVNGMAVNDNPGLEQEATQMGQEAER